MEHSTDIIQSSSTLQLSMQVHEELERWKAVKFPVPIPDYGFSEPNKILQKEVYTYAKEDNFNALFGLLSDKRDRVSSEEVLDIIFKHVAASGNSLLHVAASNGGEGVTQLLCHHFPLLITRKNFLGDNALHLAARAGLFDTIQNLVKHVKIHNRTLELASLLRMKNNKGNTPLHDAVSMGFLSGASLLVSRCPVAASQRNEEGNLPIHVACQKGHLEVVRELLPYWLDPMDFLNEKGQNILHVAAGSGKMTIVDGILGNQDLEALINEKDYDGNTPLHLAAMYCRSDIVRALASDERVDKRIVNNEKLKPSGVVAKLLQGGRFKAPKSDGMRKVLQVLVKADDMAEFDINLISNLPRTTLTTEQLNRGIGNLLVVSVLVVGVVKISNALPQPPQLQPPLLQPPVKENREYNG
uniref:Uncharacterized protein n=1 Tax=Populus alba TaxID=43335 RepID=A0A4U5QMN4_POPAL|nr:hypothetical protein D5086_0000072420 [Populus alba]